jgi:hypothetical protein
MYYSIAPAKYAISSIHGRRTVDIVVGLICPHRLAGLGIDTI